MSYKNINQLISITGITTKNIIPENEIRIVRSGGYTGSWYYANFKTPGQWYVDGSPIPNATNKIYIMQLENEGKAITFRSGEIISNTIKLFVPGQLSGLTGWFDAFSFKNDGTQNTEISTWISKIGNISFQQTRSGNYPCITTNNITGLPTVYARRTTSNLGIVMYDYMLVDDAKKLPNGFSPSHVFAATYYGKANFHTGSESDQFNNSLISWGATGNYRSPIGRNENGNIRNQTSGGQISGNSTTNPFKKNKIVSSYQNGSRGELAVDGNAVIQGNMSSNTGTKYGYLFRGVSSHYWMGSINEILIFRQKVNDINRERIEGYLAHKWKLTYLLPVNHPYKNTPPTPPGEAEIDYTINIINGTGYVGSIYQANFDEPGQWYADGVAIPGATAFTWVMTVAYEGKVIEYKSENYASNQIQMFVPDNVPGLISWFDAHTNITVGSGVVSEWRSKVGDHAATQATSSARPAYSLTGRNNLPALTADGTNDALLFNKTEHLPTGRNESHVFAVAYYVATTSSDNRFLVAWGTYANTISRRNHIIKGTNGGIYTQAGSQGPDSGGLSFYNNDRIISSFISGDTLEQHVDGKNESIVIPNASFSTVTGSAAYLMRMDSGGYWRGSVQEILILDSKANSEVRQKLEGYMAHRWGLLDKLDNNHPYKIVAPRKDDILFSSNTISIESGNGLGGSTYYADFNDPGQWYIDDVAIENETDFHFTMRSEFEGRKITFRTSEITSNPIIMFTPDALPGLNCWFDASDPDTLTMDENSKISKWTSKGSKNIYLKQDSSSNQPKFVEEGTNELPEVQTTGSSEFFEFNDGELLPNNTMPMHTFGVFSRGATSAQYLLTLGGSSSTTDRRLYINHTSTQLSLRTMFGSTSNDTTYVPFDIESSYIFSSLISNRIETTMNTTVTKSTTAITLGEGSTIGNFLFKNNASTYFHGGIQEFIIYEQELTKANQQKLEGYLASRWNTRDGLASTHPYKSNYPMLDLKDYDIKTITRIDNITYRTNMKNGSWYADGISLNKPDSTITITYDLFGKTLYYVSFGTSSDSIYVSDKNTIPYSVAQFDSSKVGYFTLDELNRVSKWETVAGNFLATNSVVNQQPIYSSTGLNGLPTVTADGTDDWLQIPSGIALDDQTAFAIIKTADTTEGTQFYNCPGIWGSEQSGSVADFGWGLANGYSMYGTQANTKYVSSPERASTNQPLMVGFDRTSSTGTGNHWFNGKANGTFAATAGTRVASAPNSAIFAMAGTFGNAGNTLQGSISELVIFDKVLTTEERQNVEGYLAQKWNLLDELPIDHPYKNGYTRTYSNTIGFSGNGSTGSIYFADFEENGQWYADGEPIYGEIYKSFIMPIGMVGKEITFRTELNISNTVTLYTPTTASLYALYDASDESTITIGSSVYWRAKNIALPSISRRFGESFTNAPKYIKNARNGLPAFVGNGSQFMVSGSSTPSGTSSSTMFAVAYHDATTYSNFRPLTWWGDTPTCQSRRHFFSNASRQISVGANDSGTTCNFSSSISWQNTDRLVVSHINGSGHQLYVDGSIAANSTSTYAFNTSPNANGFYLFRNGGSGSLYWPGSVQEIVVYSANIDTETRQLIEGYLAHKWKMNGSLPMNHPYKFVAPLA